VQKPDVRHFGEEPVSLFLALAESSALWGGNDDDRRDTAINTGVDASPYKVSELGSWSPDH